MNSAYKWIAAATGAIALFFASATVTGAIMDARDQPGSAPEKALAVQSEPLLAQALDMTAEAPAALPAPPAPSASPVATAPTEQPLVIKRVLPIDGPIKYGEWHWDEEGVPPGPLVITVDLEARVLSVFRGGYEIGAAAVMLGTQEHPTPVGTYPILSKERHNVSEKYGNAPMPWTLRLTWDGIAIHGGAEVERGYASHGCIGTPNPFVSKLFAIAKKGDTVIITRGKMASAGDRLI